MSKVLCMEIGTSTVRLAEVSKSGKKVEITKVHVFDTPDDATKDGKVRVSDEVISAIRDGIDASGITAQDVYFCCDSTKILFKQVVDMPYVAKKDILEALTLAFDEHFPVDEQLYHLAYQLEDVYEKDGRKLMALDVFAIPNDLTTSYYDLSVALNLNAKGLSDPSRSIVSLFPDNFKNRNVAMINLNENTSTLSIMVDGNMVFNKTIPYGVYGAIRQVMNSPLTMGDISFTGAMEQMYAQPVLLRYLPTGINNEDNEQEKLQYGVTTAIVTLVKTIEATFLQFLAKERIQIQEFHLSGIGAGFSGITQLLSSVFELPVAVVQDEGNLKINAAAADETLLLSCYPAVGSIIDPINFFTKDEQAGGEIAHRRKIDKICMSIAGIAFVASFTYGSYAWLQAKNALKVVEEEEARLTKRVQELIDLGVEVAYNDYTTAISYNTEVKKIYDETRSGNEDMAVFLEELENLLPQTARVAGITLMPSSADVSFMCKDKFVAAGVLHLLRNMDTISNMECAGVGEIATTGEITFVAHFTLRSTADRFGLTQDEEGNWLDAEGNIVDPNDPLHPLNKPDGEESDDGNLDDEEQETTPTEPEATEPEATEPVNPENGNTENGEDTENGNGEDVENNEEDNEENNEGGIG